MVCQPIGESLAGNRRRETRGSSRRGSLRGQGLPASLSRRRADHGRSAADWTAAAIPAGPCADDGDGLSLLCRHHRATPVSSAVSTGTAHPCESVQRDARWNSPVYVAVPSTGKKTENPRTNAERAVVSQQRWVATPVTTTCVTPARRSMALEIRPIECIVLGFRNDRERRVVEIGSKVCRPGLFRYQVPPPDGHTAGVSGCVPVPCEEYRGARPDEPVDQGADLRDDRPAARDERVRPLVEEGALHIHDEQRRLLRDEPDGVAAAKIPDVPEHLGGNGVDRSGVRYSSFIRATAYFPIFTSISSSDG